MTLRIQVSHGHQWLVAAPRLSRKPCIGRGSSEWISLAGGEAGEARGAPFQVVRAPVPA